MYSCIWRREAGAQNMQRMGGGVFHNAAKHPGDSKAESPIATISNHVYSSSELLARRLPSARLLVSTGTIRTGQPLIGRKFW